MMNKKLFLMVAMVGTLFAAGCGQKNIATAQTSKIYPNAGIIVALDESQDLVTISTGSGLLYEFYGIEDLFVGDIVAVTMDDNGTPGMVLDDKIIDSKYAGYSELFEEQNPESTMVDMSKVVDIETCDDGGAYLQMKDGTGYYWER